MSKMIFINLPVTDLEASTRFYEALGATRNPHFSNENAACMMLTDTIGVMILTHAYYGNFTRRPIADARATSQVLLALTVGERAEVDRVLEAATASGGRADPNPAQDHGSMFSRSVEDPDGHVWEIFWMDPAAVPGDSSTVDA
ncbi:lactoylglutathione lyase [Rhizobium sp. Root274]|uniref:VOC family protein n=1 Tax=unclassified Rhizobium TaxID=2613769 RepID=UPI0007140ADC|nr:MULTISPECIES: VOC family protein [unclassified Rhizobium]KQW27397.1 lactoylglutathione lyase [Rhizobium sp. Root1240]KRD27632.1 lactoylglutathione lyase [Rhizobium sp. Root274]